MTSDQGIGNALPFPPSVRASVERGDPLVIFGRSPRGPHGLFHWPELATATAEAEAHASESVAADAEILDTDANRNYGDAMTPHEVDSASRLNRRRSTGEADQRRAWSEESRLAFLARVQRIDPRERKSAPKL